MRRTIYRHQPLPFDARNMNEGAPPPPAREGELAAFARDRPRQPSAPSPSEGAPFPRPIPRGITAQPSPATKMELMRCSQRVCCTPPESLAMENCPTTCPTIPYGRNASGPTIRDAPSAQPRRAHARLAGPGPSQATLLLWGYALCMCTASARPTPRVGMGQGVIGGAPGCYLAPGAWRLQLRSHPRSHLLPSPPRASRVAPSVQPGPKAIKGHYGMPQHTFPQCCSHHCSHLWNFFQVLDPWIHTCPYRSNIPSVTDKGPAHHLGRDRLGGAHVPPRPHA